jgi:hypothetical protein
MGGCGPFFDEAANVDVVMVPSFIRQPVDQIGIAVIGEDHRPIPGEEAVKIRSADAVRMGLDVLGSQWLSKQRVAHQINLANRNIVCGAPISIKPTYLLLIGGVHPSAFEGLFLREDGLLARSA